MDAAAAAGGFIAVAGGGGRFPRASVEVPGAPAIAKLEGCPAVGGTPAVPETLELVPEGWC